MHNSMWEITGLWLSCLTRQTTNGGPVRDSVGRMLTVICMAPRARSQHPLQSLWYYQQNDRHLPEGESAVRKQENGLSKSIVKV